MKIFQITLIFLGFITGISCNEKITLKKEKASLIPAIVKNIRFDKSLGNELIQARQSGILSDYQFSIWMDVYGKQVRTNDAIRINFRGAINGPGAGFDGYASEDWNTYHSTEWAFYDNHAYAGEWEMGLWQFVE